MLLTGEPKFSLVRRHDHLQGKTMRSLIRTASVGLLATLLLAACGGTDGGDNGNNGDQCTVPSGTYTATFTDAGGNCSQLIVDELTSTQFDNEVESDEACGMYTSETTDELDNGCTLTTTIQGYGNSSGIEDATAEINIDCPDSANNCSHNFNADFAYQE